MVLSGVSIQASPNLDIRGVKIDSKAHLRRPCAWYCFSCLSENWYFEVGETYFCGHLCYFVAILHLFSQSSSIGRTLGFHLLLQEFNLSKLRPQLIHWSSRYLGVERHNLLGLSCRRRFECGITFPTLCLTPERWIGSTVQSTTVVASMCCVFFSFLWRRCLWGCKNNL